MRLWWVTMAVSVAAATANAEDLVKVVGFVTVDGRHLAPLCTDVGGVVARLSFTDLAGKQPPLEVEVTCASAPAAAFATELPSGRYTVRVTPAEVPSALTTGFTATVTVKGPRTTLSLEAPAVKAPTARVTDPSTPRARPVAAAPR